MDEDFSATLLADYTQRFQELSPKNQGRVMAHIILLLESQKQDIDLNFPPNLPKKRK